MALPRIPKSKRDHCEVAANIAFTAVTAVHEWGNLVGYSALPVLVALVVHLLFTVTGEGE